MYARKEVAFSSTLSTACLTESVDCTKKPSSISNATFHVKHLHQTSVVLASVICPKIRAQSLLGWWTPEVSGQRNYWGFPEGLCRVSWVEC